MKLAKRLFALLLVVLTLFSFVPHASAASVNLNETAKEHLPNWNNISIRSYALSTSGRITSFNDSSLRTRNSGWIDARTDECTIQKIANGGRALYIKFPIGGGKYISRWFDSNEFIGTNLGQQFPVLMTTKQITTYRRYNGGSTYGYTGSGDKIYVIGVNGNYTGIVYPLTGGGYKLGYVKNSDIQNGTRIISNKAPSQSFAHPMKNFHKNYTQWGVKPSYRSGERQYHVGVDYMSNSDSNVYAFASGKVVAAGWQSANGNYILIQHDGVKDKYGNAKTVYSFYAHLNSYCVKKGQTVTVGQKIGVVGKTGSSAGSVKHLHFAVIDYKWTSGGVYGYVSAFSGDKVTYKGVTYYNPYYIVTNGRLP